MKILILANSRYKGGLSGSDAIYENFVNYWPCEISVQDLQWLDYDPFLVCYIHRICLSITNALFDTRYFDLVYSSSDFLPDALAGFIYKIRRRKWVAGFYLKAFRQNRIHFFTQKIVLWLISRFADMVVVTNPTMYPLFPTKAKTWINGGVDLKLAGLSDKPKIYDAVFCGRIHPSKGIDELLEIWNLVIKEKPNARLAIIGDGDLGLNYIRFHKKFCKGIDLLGYMGKERYEIYKQSKIVLYPTPLKYDHFSMAPIEAMACGCQMICFGTPIVMKMMCGDVNYGKRIDSFANVLINLIDLNIINGKSSLAFARQFAYKKEALRVYTDITKELYAYPDNRFERNGRKFINPDLKRPRINNTK